MSLFLLNKKEKDRIKGRKGGDEGRQVNLSGKRKAFQKRESVEKLISFLGAFHRKMNQVKIFNKYREVSK